MCRFFGAGHGSGIGTPNASPWLQVTFGATNLTNQPIRMVFGYENAPYQVFYPGAAYYLGLRAKF